MIATRAFGVGLLVVGGLAIGFALQIKEPGLGQNQDPGPRALPIALGVLLVLGGVVELIRSVLGKSSAPGGDCSGDEPSESIRPAWNVGLFNTALIFGGLCLYAGLLGILGFTWATLLFGVGMMVRLGVRWSVSLGVTVGLIGVIHFLFGVLFKVQLPASSIGLPL